MRRRGVSPLAHRAHVGRERGTDSRLLRVFRPVVAGVGGLRCFPNWALEHGAGYLVSSARWFYGQRGVLLLLGLFPILDGFLGRSAFHIALESGSGLTCGPVLLFCSAQNHKRPTEFKSMAGTRLDLVTYNRKKE